MHSSEAMHWRLGQLIPPEQPAVAVPLSIHSGFYPVHDHDFLEMGVVVGGRGFHVTPQRETPLQTGDLFVLRPSTLHGYTRCRRLKILNCCLGLELLHQELAWIAGDSALNQLFQSGPVSKKLPPIAFTRLEGGALAQYRRLWRDLNALIREPGCRSRFEILARLLRLLGTVAEGVKEGTGEEPPAPVPQASPVQSLIRRMERELARPWTLREMAAETRMHPSYLIRLFKAQTGLPPMEYLARCRANRAALLLSSTLCPIKEIAYQVGWPDPNYFSRRFRACFGMNASAYRRISSLPRETKRPQAGRGEDGGHTAFS